MAALTLPLQLAVPAVTDGDTTGGTRLHRCGGCPRTWNGLSEAHCSACHEQFGSVTAFDLHRVKNKCREPWVVVRKSGHPVYERRDRSGGPTWVLGRAGGHYWKDAA